MHLSRVFVVLSLVLAALALAACGDDDSEPANTTEGEASACAKDQLALVSPGTLTVGTDKPAFPPYFVDDDPTNGKGFESAVAYAVADELGFAEGEVEWTVVPFNASYAPGPKDFDFDINQISITPQREKAVDFSRPYYTAPQAVVAKKNSEFANAETFADLLRVCKGARSATLTYSSSAEALGLIDEFIR
jgi:polar amino acid transport system substrate-binding protein